MIKKIILLPVLLSALINSANACTIKVSWETWSPYQLKNSTGKMTGLDIELAEAIAKSAGCKITFLDYPWTRQLSLNESGEIDVVMGASKTPEREIFATFTDGYRNETNSLFILKGRGNEIKTISDLGKSNLKIGITRGVEFIAEINAMKPKLDETADNDEQNLKKALAGRIDGFLVDQFTGFALIKAAKASNKIVIHPLNISSGDVYLMVSKKTKIADLTQKLSIAIRKIKTNGIYGKIIAKYK